jgi:ribosomal protein S18 acetylase RimI-like enzyme
MSHRTFTHIVVAPLESDHAAACEAIGRALPAWFGIEEGLEDLRHCAETQAGVVALAGDAVVGFVTLTRHFPETWEITWMAVHPNRHRRGIGRRLVEAAVERCREEGATTLLVKTLADTHPSPEYARTRAFYQALGFSRLEVFPDLWGPHNPCLLLARTIAAHDGD